MHFKCFLELESDTKDGSHYKIKCFIKCAVMNNFQEGFELVFSLEI